MVVGAWFWGSRCGRHFAHFVQRESCDRRVDNARTGADLAKRFAEHRTKVASLNDTIESLERQIAKGKRRITPEIIDRFGNMLREKLEADDPALRKAYVRLIVGKVGLGNDQITICGSKLALEHALVRGDRHPGGVVPSFDREWCPEEETKNTPMILIRKI